MFFFATPRLGVRLGHQNVRETRTLSIRVCLRMLRVVKFLTQGRKGAETLTRVFLCDSASWRAARSGLFSKEFFMCEGAHPEEMKID